MDERSAAPKMNHTSDQIQAARRWWWGSAVCAEADVCRDQHSDSPWHFSFKRTGLSRQHPTQPPLLPPRSPPPSGQHLHYYNQLEGLTTPWPSSSAHLALSITLPRAHTIHSFINCRSSSPRDAGLCDFERYGAAWVEGGSLRRVLFPCERRVRGDYRGEV